MPYPRRFLSYSLNILFKVVEKKSIKEGITSFAMGDFSWKRRP
jgi:hypothetical protein